MMTPPTRPNPLKIAILIAAIAVAAIAGYAAATGAFSSSDGPDRVAGTGETPEDRTPTLEDSDETAATDRVWLLVDGWSVATLRSPQVVFDDGEQARQATLEPISSGDLDQLLAESPDAVEQTAGRLLTSDGPVSCDSGGCVADGEQLDLDLLLDPRDHGQLGDVYTDWQVSSGLYVAALDVPEGTDLITVSADGVAGFTLSVDAAADPALSTDGRPDELADSGDPVDDGLAAPTPAGYVGEGRWLLGAAFETFFPLRADWIDPDLELPEGGQVTGLEPRSIVEAADIAGLSFHRGLHRGVELMHGSANWLTYLSSPSVSCGAGVACAPGPVQIDVDVQDEEIVYVCDESVTVAAAIREATWENTGSRPVLLAGAGQVAPGESVVMQTVVLAHQPDLALYGVYGGAVEAAEAGSWGVADLEALLNPSYNVCSAPGGGDGSEWEDLADEYFQNG